MTDLQTRETQMPASGVLPATAEQAPRLWVAFWGRGGWWRAVLLVVSYLAVYCTLPLVLMVVQAPVAHPFGNPLAMLIGLGGPISIGAVILILFAASLRWLPVIFARQPAQTSWWMWLAPAVVFSSAVFRIIGTDYSQYEPAVIASTWVVGIFIGLSEELLARGLVVHLLRRGGYGERAVMLLSSLAFALMHGTNLLAGQPVTTVAVTVVFAFVFGIAMYLTMRATGSIMFAIALHAVTDPSTMLASGGVDAGHASSAMSSIGGLAPFFYVVIAIIAVFAVKGRVAARASR